MIRSAFIIILLSIFCKTRSQDYHTIRTGSDAYFTNPAGFIRAIRIDSLKVDGTDTILYNFNNIIAVDYDCYGTDLGSWIGRPVLVRENGDTYYFNLQNDSILVCTRAGLNENWIFYRWPDKRKIEAKVIAIEEDSVLDMTDSVKTIELKVLDSLDNAVDHKLNGMILKLSKSYGLIHLPGFLAFPDGGVTGYFYHEPDPGPFALIGLTNPARGQTNLGWFDVFDYNVGDEFHTEYHNQCDPFISASNCVNITRYSIERILSRTDFPDSIIYVKEIKTKTYHTAAIDTIRSKIIRNNNFRYLPGEIICPDCDEANSYLMYASYGSFVKSTPSIYSAVYKNPEDTCWYMPVIDEGDYSGEYVKGVGGPFFYYESPFSFLREYRFLEFYKKGDKTWGTPLIIMDIKKPGEALSVMTIYPNPAEDLITVTIREPFANPYLEIWNLCGQKILEQYLTGQSIQVDISSLSSGIYFIRIRYISGQEILKLVVK
jgi:hypothetical protein